MQLNSVRKFIYPKKTLYFLVIVLLVLGVFFRFVNLDRKVYWLDETHTLLRIYGYEESEFIEDIFTGKIVNSEDLLKYQRFSTEKDWGDAIRVVSGNTEHAPLYYFTLRAWTQIFGSSIVSTRAWSAILSLLAFPCIYWLCLELFESPSSGWMAIALLAISPFQILYAQEARPYSLLTVTTLFASAALLRAVRVRNKLSWVIYGISLILGLYTHWFFSLVMISHAIYLIVIEKFRLNKTIIAYTFTSLLGVIAFSPWIINTVTSPPPLKKQMGWVFQQAPILTLIKSWGLNISRAFIDFDSGWCFPAGSSSCRYLLNSDGIITYIFITPVIALVGYSFYFLCYKTSLKTWFFVISLIGVTASALILPDLVKGGLRSTVTRYTIPCLLGFQLAVAYCLASHIYSNYLSQQKQKLWRVVTVILISLGIISCVMIIPASGWWSKGGNYHVTPIANTINQTNRPLLIYSVPSDVLWGKGGAVGRVMPLSRQLDPKVGILFVAQPNVPEKIPNVYSDLFLYRPHKDLVDWLEKKQNYQLKPMRIISEDKPRLWKAEKLN